VKLLKENPGLKLAIEGHTDDVGAKPANEKLSRDRAAAVVDALAAAGIARDRLKSSGAGADKPVADNATSEGRAKNRRVELVKG
jgi:outer membrane protein OmpA-like peptidoglycan-associated protein